MTTTTTDLAAIPNDVLKTDCLGRTRFPATLRNELLDRFETSGMTGVEFAEFYHIKYPTFATWRQNRKRQRHQACQQAEAGGFLELALPEPTRDIDLQIELPGGARMNLSSLDQVRVAAELLKALGSC